MRNGTVRMVKMEDVPRKAGWAMHSKRDEQQIPLSDIFVMIFRLFVCGKSFRAESRQGSGEAFRLAIIREKNEYYQDVTSFDLVGWQLQQMLFSIEAFKKYPALGDRVKILLMLRRCGALNALKWSMVETSLASCSLAELVEV